ncbi:MAG: 3-hydroxyacyl-CoA dehydrogenase family protein [Ferruginibacter sp.]
MTIAVFGNNKQWEEIQGLPANAGWVRLEAIAGRPANADAYFVMDSVIEFDFNTIAVPVFINAVDITLSSLHAPVNVIRLNGWNGFLKNETWEIAGSISGEAQLVLSSLNKKHTIVPDKPGFVSARIIAMIINEAYFALEDNVSTKEEIDIAMKLGTNYPFGPFEWAGIIGIKNICSLLEALSLTDERCKPCPLLKKEAAAWD